MIFSFHPFELDEERRELRRNGDLVEVQPKVLDLLIFLVQHRGRVVSRNEALDAVWPGVFISDDALFRAVSRAREAVGDDGKRQVAIKTLRGTGFRFVADVEERDTILEPVSIASTHSPVVGRVEVIEQLDTALDAAFAGRGQAAWLTGEAGIGKTHMCRVVAERARRRGAVVHAAWASEGGGAPAFGVWGQLLGDMFEDVPIDSLAESLGPASVSLVHVLPELTTSSALAAPSASINAEQAQFLLVRAVARLLRDAAAKHPRLLILDDLHWADAASIRLLEQLPREVEDQRILILGVYREEDLVPRHPLRSVVGTFARHGSTTSVRLAPLSATEVREFVCQIWMEEPSPQLAHRLWLRTGGNPFYVAQFAHVLDRSLEGIGPPSDLEVLPPGLQSVLEARLFRLSEGTQLMLLIASVIGEEFSFEVLQEVVRLSRAQLLEHLEEAASGGIVRDEVGRFGRYHFLHALMREALSRSLSTVRRAEIHFAIGEAIETLYPAKLAENATALAHHFMAAKEIETPLKGIRYALIAGRRAAEQFAWEDAILLLERALGASDSYDPSGHETRFEILHELGAASFSAGDGRRAREQLRAAAEAALAAGDSERFTIAAITHAQSFWLLEPDLESAAMLERSLVLLDEDSPQRARAMAWLAHARTNDPGSREASEALLAESADHAELSGDDSLRLEIMSIRLRAQRVWGLPNPGERLVMADAAIELAHRVDDPARSLLVSGQRIGPLLELADVRAIDEEIARFSTRSSELQMATWSWAAPLLAVMRSLLQGKFDDAESHVQRVFAASSRFKGVRSFGPLAGLAALFLLRREQGRLGELETPLRELLGEFSVHRDCLLALVLLEKGRMGEAESLFDSLSSGGFSRLVGSESWVTLLSVAAEVGVRRGRHEACEALHDWLEPYAGLALCVGEGGLCAGPAGRIVGRLAGVLGRFEDAERHFEAATAVAERLESPPWLAWTRFDHGCVLRVQGGSESKRAEHLIDRARATARELGMNGLLARADALEPT